MPITPDTKSFTWVLDRPCPFADWDQDATAAGERYGEQDPAVVTQELGAAALQVAVRFDGLTAAQWTRTGRRSDGAVFTVGSCARCFVHDPVHHLHDVRARPLG